MCGRFTLKTPVVDYLKSLFPELSDRASSIADEFVRAYPAATNPRYNIAPTQDIVIASIGVGQSTPTLRCVRWGLIPHWADSLKAGYTMINARSETLMEKTSFKSLLAGHRCVVIADGYYEWRLPSKSPETSKATKQPFWIHRTGTMPFAMAGLWTENRRMREIGPIISATIITTAANEDTISVHDRMPVLWSDPEIISRWLSPKAADSETVLEMLQPSPSGSLVMHPVSTRVNTPKENEPEMINSL